MVATILATECPYEYCDAPDVACNLGADSMSDCPHWKTRTTSQSQTEAETSPDIATEVGIVDNNVLPAWSGNSLGRRDLEFIAGRARPYLVGIVGPHNAGKTTLLTAIYLLASLGESLDGAQFSGSYTLGGWEGLAYSLRWRPGSPPVFPPHTSSKDGRQPGLLHLALRYPDKTNRDVLFTDAPGEWFARWTLETNSPAAEGARWIHRHADAFLLVADCEALAGGNRGAVKEQLKEMARRLSSGLGARHVCVVWSKSESPVPPAIEMSLKETFDQVFSSQWSEFRVSLLAEPKHPAKESETSGAVLGEFSRQGLLDVVAQVLAPFVSQTSQSVSSLPVSRPQDPLLAFRGK